MADVPDMQMIPYLRATEPRNFVEQGLQRYNELLERLGDQMESLLELARQGQPIDPQLAEQLISLREALRPRHGLCIDRACFCTAPASPAAFTKRRSRNTSCSTSTGNCPAPSSSWNA